MKSRPLVSFCIATYKRQQFLKETIRSALLQTYSNIEIIVADNDPYQSAKPIVDSFRSKKLFYAPQKKNVGMIKNFITATSHANGDFIVLMADDDPLEPQMIEKLVELSIKYPTANSYYGAPYLLMVDKKGKISMRNKKIKKGEIRVFSPKTFMPSFLKYEIFDYFLWSAGMARSSVAKRVMPHLIYGSNYLTDFAYIMAVGLSGPMVTINEELAYQTIHKDNFGRSNKNLVTLKIAVLAFYKNFTTNAKKFNCSGDLKNFLRNWVTNHIVSVLRFRIINKEPKEKLFLIKIYADITNSLPFFKRRKMSFYFRIIFPAVAKIYDDHKWIFEKRTSGRAFAKLRIIPR